MKDSANFLTAALASICFCFSSSVEAQVIPNDPGGTDQWYEAPSLWFSGGASVSPPNGVGVEVRFNGAATADNPNQTANRTIQLDQDTTVGRLVFNTDREYAASGTSTNRVGQIPALEVSPGVFATLTFDAASGDATIFLPQAPVSAFDASKRVHSLSSITAPMVLADNLVLTNDNTGSQTFFGTFHLQGPMSGPGGFTKFGEGRTNFEHTTAGGASDAAKTYTGATVINGGSFSLSPISAPAQSSSFTLNGTAQLEPAYDGAYQLGAGSLILNPSGAGLSAAGVIRPRRGTGSGVVTINNDIVLQSTSIIHSKEPNGGGPGEITLLGDISGGAGAQLQFTAFNDYFDVGDYILQGANTYAGGTLVRAGRLALTTSAATLGVGDVTVENNGVGTPSLLEIQGIVSDAFASTATLSLAGGGTAGVADWGAIDIDINETVAELVLGGAPQGAGVYTSASHPEYITGSGSITVVPAAVEDADFDQDGDIDGADFLTWQRNVAVDTGATLSQGDADGNGDVNGADLAIWEGQFGTATAAAGAIPEPSAALLALLAAPPALLARRKR